MPYDEITAFRALLSTTPNVLYFIDREGKYLYVGATTAKSLGLTPDAMIGRTPREVGISEEISARFDEQRREVMSTRRAITEESVYEMPGGTQTYEYMIAPVIENGEAAGVLVIARDVTERRNAEAALRASQAKFSTAFDRSPLALTITSLEDGRLVEVNEGFVRMSGYTHDEAVGRSPDELGLWIDPKMRATRFERMRNGLDVPEIEAQFRVRDGEVLTGVVASAVVEIDGRPCVLSSVVDITERKRAEEAKDQFLATLSHELRTPLTSAYGWVKLLSRNDDPELMHSGMRAIEESLVNQIHLIDDLLDVSRVAAGKMHVHRQPVDLGAIVDAAVEMAMPAAKAKDIELHVELRAVTTIDGDAARLKQVFWNLLANAVKFTPARGRVDVVLRERDGNAEVIVRDSGEGIDPSFLPHVFDRFRQADSSISRRHGGLGIGLSIVSSLVAAHDGTVRAESDGRDRGATFTVTLPLIERADSVHPTLGDGRKRSETLDGVRVLVVDDDAGSRELMRIMLQWGGAEVRECASAPEALATFGEWQPDLLITDLAMPHEDGYSLLRKVRASHDHIPAIAITAYARTEDEERVRAAGFQRHIAKPFDPRELVEAVRELVQKP